MDQVTKLLDSAIRLPIQAHPDRTASQRLFHSPYGKTEAWIVLGGRRINGEEPYLLMGFNDRFDFEVFRREALSGVMDQTLGMMHRYPITPGEVILIPGGFPHAIGSGVLVQEIMEPTDWVIQPEARCGEQPLTMQDRFGGLDPEEALSSVPVSDPLSDEDPEFPPQAVIAAAIAATIIIANIFFNFIFLSSLPLYHRKSLRFTVTKF